MKTCRLILFASVALLIMACSQEDTFIPVDYDFKWFPDIPKNIIELNSAYDDYNSNIEKIGNSFALYYSSNRDSEGDNYDIESSYFDIHANYQDTSIEFEIIKDYDFWSPNLRSKMNSKYYELGPFSFDYLLNATDTHSKDIFLFATDKSGYFEIQFMFVDIGECAHDPGCKIYGPYDAKVLNSAFNDLYPTINFNRYFPTQSAEVNQFFFCSDRAGDFDIYKVNINSTDVKEWLQTSDEEAFVCNVLSSEYDDKCPYIKGNLMVFASNRRGGYGGFDLWYSVFENNEWCEPVNFGPKINTQSDEYRPVVEYFEDSQNDFMIFSSNRHGGSGGFDLYYVGIEKMILNK